MNILLKFLIILNLTTCSEINNKKDIPKKRNSHKNINTGQNSEYTNSTYSNFNDLINQNLESKHIDVKNYNNHEIPKNTNNFSPNYINDKNIRLETKSALINDKKENYSETTNNSVSIQDLKIFNNIMFNKYFIKTNICDNKENSKILENYRNQINNKLRNFSGKIKEYYTALNEIFLGLSISKTIDNDLIDCKINFDQMSYHIQLSEFRKKLLDELHRCREFKVNNFPCLETDIRNVYSVKFTKGMVMTTSNDSRNLERNTKAIKRYDFFDTNLKICYTIIKNTSINEIKKVRELILSEVGIKFLRTLEPKNKEKLKHLCSNLVLSINYFNFFF